MDKTMLSSRQQMTITSNIKMDKLLAYSLKIENIYNSVWKIILQAFVNIHKKIKNERKKTGSTLL